MVTEGYCGLTGGRTLHYYDTVDHDTSDHDTSDHETSAHETSADGRTAIFWLHGTPNIGTPPEPLFAAAARSGLRWVSYDRPGYGGSSPRPDRDIASAADDVAMVADALGIDRFAVLGHSGGGPHALACGALLPDRVLAVVSVSAPAPPDAHGLDWFDGWNASGVAEQRAARAGRAALEAYLPTAEFDRDTFTADDWAALEGNWSWFDDVVAKALEHGNEGMVEDLLAGAWSWGFALPLVTAPTLILHGAADRMVPAAHADWLAQHCPGAELRLVPEAGHISVLDSAPAALEWVRARLA